MNENKNHSSNQSYQKRWYNLCNMKNVYLNIFIGRSQLKNVNVRSSIFYDNQFVQNRNRENYYTGYGHKINPQN